VTLGLTGITPASASGSTVINQKPTSPPTLMCLQGNANTNGGLATLQPCNGGALGQQWTAVYTNMDMRDYTIENGYNQCLGINHHYTTAGAHVIVRKCSGAADEYWGFDSSAYSGDCKIVNVNSRLVIGPANGDTTQGTDVNEQTPDGYLYQLWSEPAGAVC